MHQAYFAAGMAAGACILSICTTNSKLRTSFAAWNWPSFGAGAAFALALFIIAGKLVV